ncbi:MAG TPA: orotidine-5'-phosphate decarboxylase [Gemmatimonadales bacterium]|nr:orotidine-5'-phosphate decarboxylase [Gemmatimonadales bacterium]
MAEVIVALDQDSAAAALTLVERLPGLKWAKVGATLYVREGPAVVRALRDRGVEVFLDLKWHDIPNQVAGAARAAADLGVSLASVHTLGGPAMLQAARAAAGPMRLVGITVLTSHDAAELGTVIGRSAVRPEDEVLRLAGIARDAGLAGVVAGAGEVAPIRKALGGQMWLVVPGIRAAGSPPDDQRRTADAGSAARAGATHLVVGRPITGAVDPDLVYQRLCQEAR